MPPTFTQKSTNDSEFIFLIILNWSELNFTIRRLNIALKKRKNYLKYVNFDGMLWKLLWNLFKWLLVFVAFWFKAQFKLIVIVKGFWWFRNVIKWCTRLQTIAWWKCKDSKYITIDPLITFHLSRSTNFRTNWSWKIDMPQNMDCTINQSIVTYVALRISHSHIGSM